MEIQELKKVQFHKKGGGIQNETFCLKVLTVGDILRRPRRTYVNTVCVSTVVRVSSSVMKTAEMKCIAVLTTNVNMLLCL